MIADCNAWMLFEAEYNRENTVLVAELHPVTGTIIQQEIRPVNRAFNAVIEAVILATRYKIFRKDKYLLQIESYSNTIYKCGGSTEKNAYDLIFRLL